MMNVLNLVFSVFLLTDCDMYFYVSRSRLRYFTLLYVEESAFQSQPIRDKVYCEDPHVGFYDA